MLAVTLSYLVHGNDHAKHWYTAVQSASASPYTLLRQTFLSMLVNQNQGKPL